MTWPVGQGKTFGGIINLRTQAMTVFESGSERRPQDFETDAADRPGCCSASATSGTTAIESMELATGASPAWDHEAFLAASRRRCSSAPA
jgi:peptide chain release factor 3